MYQVILSLDEKGNLIGVEPKDREGKILNPVLKKLGVDWTSNGTIDNVTNITILSKPDHSPCCVINGGKVWCWC